MQVVVRCWKDVYLLALSYFCLLISIRLWYLNLPLQFGQCSKVPTEDNLSANREGVDRKSERYGHGYKNEVPKK